MYVPLSLPRETSIEPLYVRNPYVLNLIAFLIIAFMRRYRHVLNLGRYVRGDAGSGQWAVLARARVDLWALEAYNPGFPCTLRALPVEPAASVVQVQVPTSCRAVP